jgi:hypothetical protein
LKLAKAEVGIISASVTFASGEKQECLVMANEANCNAVILQIPRNEGRPVTVMELLEYVKAQRLFDIGELHPRGRRLPPSMWDSAILRRLDELRGLGLLVVAPRKKLRLFGSAVYEVQIAPRFIDIQNSLGFSLTEAATRKPNSLQVTPVFPFPNKEE